MSVLMAKNTDPGSNIVSAQVSLTVAGAAHVSEVMETLERAGFEVAAAFGNSFSITASSNHFEQVFGVSLDRSPSAARNELPPAALPANVRGYVDRILFTQAPDFGPSNW